MRPKLLDLADTIAENPFLSEIVPLIYSTADAYFVHIFGSSSAALQQLQIWSNRDSSEYYCRRAQVVLEGDACAGVLLRIPGTDVPNCRKADTLALVLYRRKHPDLVNMPVGSAAPVPVPPDSLYIRAIAVGENYKRRGYGQLLLESSLEYAREHGLVQVRLDVREDNEAAVKLYSRFGFELAGGWMASTGESMLAMLKRT